MTPCLSVLEVMFLRGHAHAAPVAHVADVRPIIQAVGKATWAILAALVEAAVMAMSYRPQCRQLAVANALGNRIVASVAEASGRALACEFARQHEASIGHDSAIHAAAIPPVPVVVK